MSNYLTMPRLGETMEEGILSKWLVEPGQAFKRGETIAEIETDKTLVEFPALEDGEIIAYLVGEGDVVPVGGKLAELTGEAQNVGEQRKATGESESVAESPTSASSASRAAAAYQDSSDKIPASPAARRLAQQSQVNLATVSGTGRRGRIQAEDVRAAGIRGGGVQGASGRGEATRGATARGAGKRTGSRPDAGQDLDQLYAKVLGPATDEAIVFLHGFAGDADAWINVQLPLARDMLTVAFDLPGHARSRSHPGTNGVMAMAAAVIKALEQRGLDQVHLVGHSMGGAIAASVGLQACERVKSLTLLAPAGLGPDLNHRLLRRLAEMRDRVSIAIVLEQLIGWGSRLPKGMAEIMSEQREDPEVTAKYREVLQTLLKGDSQHVLPLDQVNALPLPMRLIWGSRDTTVPIEHAAALWAASLYRFDGIGHLPHMEIPQEVIALIRQACCKPAEKQTGED